jgi:uncharacterized damage-inducible protein DinB
MKSPFLLIPVCFLLSGSAFCQTQVQSAPANSWVAEWQRAKGYTKEYLDAMPEDGYAFKPTPEVRTFARQFRHLAVDNYRFASQAIGKADPYPDANSDKTEEDPAGQSKAAVTKFTMDSYDYVIDALKTLTPVQLQENVPFFRRTMSREMIFFKCFEHQTHHRGQAVVYLRLKGVIPPREKLL